MPARTLVGRATGLAIATARTTRAAEALHDGVLKDRAAHSYALRSELEMAQRNLRNALDEVTLALSAVNATLRSR